MTEKDRGQGMSRRLGTSPVVVGLALGETCLSSSLIIQTLLGRTLGVFMLYGHVALMMALWGGILVWMGRGSRANQPTFWRQLLMVGFVLIWPLVLWRYWWFLHRMLPMLPDSGLSNTLSYGIHWVLTAGCALLTLYVVRVLLVQGRLLFG